MEKTEVTAFIEKLIETVEKLIPEFMENPADRNVSNGNVAICVIDEKGSIHGKLFGVDKIRSRQSFKIAWTKASQVWITGMKTGEFEKAVFNNQVDEHKFGILRPDFVGWEGGQHFTVNSDTKIYAGFSGFRGFRDAEIVAKAYTMLRSGKAI